MDYIINEHTRFDVIKIKGRIDSYSAPILEKALLSRIDNGRSKFLIDMEEVSFISSSGILIFVNQQKQLANQEKGKIAFLSISNLLLSSFQLAGFDRLFEFFENQDAASRYF